MKGRILIIAGSDPSGGAGLQADIKTVTALGGYAAAAVTALTVQNTMGVKSVHPVAPSLICDQIMAVLEDIGADAIKIGMIADKDAAEAIAEILRKHAGRIPVVLDPVQIATSGDALAGEGVIGVMLDQLVPLAAVVTPNAGELEALTGLRVATTQAMREAGCALRKRTNAALLLKGGHVGDEEVADVLMDGETIVEFRNPRIESTSTHGTGCTLASAVATGIAQGLPLEASAGRAIAFVREAIRTAPGFGKGHGPLNHAHPVKPR